MYNLSPTKAIIKLNNIRHNLNLFRGYTGHSEMMAVIKANAYGHGAVQVAKCLESEGITWFAVATVPEAIELRENGVKARILVLGAPIPEALPAYEAYHLDLNLHDKSLVDRLTDVPYHLNIHVKVDTGMTRLGILPAEFEEVTAALAKYPRLNVVANWSHYACSDDFAQDDFTRFQRDLFSVIAKQKNHIQNTAGILNPIAHSEKNPPSIVRIGVGIWGFDPCEPQQLFELRPAMLFQSRIVQVKWITKGSSVSYGRTWFAPEDTFIATVAAGYADGYTRSLSNKGWVEVNHQRYPVVGRICMDMFMIHVGRKQTVSEGDEVTLWGSDTLSASEVARWAETIPYTLVTGVSHRVPRFFVEE